MSMLPSGAAGRLEQISGVYARRIAFTQDGRDLDVYFMSLDVPTGP